MSKRKWHARAIHLAVALALCLGLTMVPAVAGANGLTVSLTGDPDHCWTPLNVTFNATTSAGVAPYTYTFTWNDQYKQWGEEDWKNVTAATLLSDPILANLFTQVETEVVVSSATTISKTHEFTVPGYYNVLVEVEDSTGTALTGDATCEIRTVGILPSPIAYDVKGATQQIEVKGVNVTAAGTSIDWWLESGVELDPGDVTLTVPAPDKPTESGDFTATVKSMRKGDIHIYAAVTDPGCGNRTFHTEKKWGELDHTTLDVDPVVDGVQHEEYVTVDPDATEDIEEVITDMAYATFIDVSGPVAVGHAITHWWLFKDTDADQDFIDDLMDYLAANEGALDDNYWAAHGKYVIDDLDGKQPFDYINDYGKGLDGIAGTTDDRFADPDIFDWDAISPLPPGVIVDPWYAWTQTEDSFPAEVRGRAQATLTVDVTDLEECVEEKVMIVVLVTYPGGTTEQEDPFSGENMVCLEKGKKTFHKGPKPPPAEQIKVAQVRWAGEKIVLEKDWDGDPEDVGHVSAAGQLVGFFLEEGCVGNLIPFPGDEGIAPDVYIISEDARTAFTACGCDGIARAMFESEQQGEVDVKCVLYDVVPAALGGMSFGDIVAQLLGDELQVVGNHGFLVYYLALEDVTVDHDLSDQLLEDPDDDANVLVKVRGWFTSDALPGTNRDPVVSDDGITYLRPGGRYIFPDDWAALAGSSEATSNMASRPQYDLMNTPGDGVVSTAELGPYDSGVRTTTPPLPVGAANPSIGPFNSLQPWNSVDALGNPTNKWIATASVQADMTVAPLAAVFDAADLRNTVVPDGTIDESDCPMSQALVTFTVDDSTLTALDKGTVLGYGIDAGGNFMAPFYAVEIPSHWLIPVAGYLWDSWGWTADTTIRGPYDYWGDLGLTPNDADILEVYSDNHGYAGVTVDALEEEGCVTVDIIVDFPVAKAKYPAIDTEKDICWGAAIEHLDADFEVSDRTGEAPITISFYGLKAAGTGAPWTTGGTQPYVKAEWDFDGDGTIDTTVTGATSAVTLATQTHEFTTANSYSPWLRVTDDNGLVDICEKPNYIVLTGPAGYAACDIDESGTVNITDFVLFAGDYGSNPGDPNWNDGRSDLDGMNGVGILDFVIFAQCYVAHAD